VHRMVCPFTPQLSLVLINRPRRDGTLSWRWCTAAAGGIRTRDRKSGTVPHGHVSVDFILLNFYHASPPLSAVIGIPINVCLFVCPSRCGTFNVNENRSTCTIMQFSPNCSSKTLVFGDGIQKARASDNICCARPIQITADVIAFFL